MQFFAEGLVSDCGVENGREESGQTAWRFCSHDHWTHEKLNSPCQLSTQKAAFHELEIDLIPTIVLGHNQLPASEKSSSETFIGVKSWPAEWYCKQQECSRNYFSLSTRFSPNFSGPSNCLLPDIALFRLSLNVSNLPPAILTNQNQTFGILMIDQHKCISALPLFY